MHVLNKNIIVVIFLFLSSGCKNIDRDYSSEIPLHVHELENVTIFNSTENQTSTIRFTSDKIFGNTNDVMIGIIGGVEVDKEGRVYLADTNQNTIHIYNSDGKYLTNAGRQGSGPGEFRNIVYTAVDSNRLYALDWAQQAIHIFSLNTLDFVSTIVPAENRNNIEDFEGGHPGEFFVRQDSTFLMSFIQSRGADKLERNQFYLVNFGGKIISEKIIEQIDVRFQYQLPVPAMIVVLPFYRKPLILISKNDHILTAWTDEFLIKRYNQKGEYVSAIYHPFPNVDIDIEEIKSRYDSPQTKNAIHNASFSETTWPAIDEMLIDDENRLLDLHHCRRF